MNRKLILASVIFVISISVFGMIKFRGNRGNDDTVSLRSPETEENTPPENLLNEADEKNIPEAPKEVRLFQSSLDRAGERITKKKFGQYITPQNSPVQPEKFRGYHTGTDFEIFPEEASIDVPVRAICDGKIAVKKTATGYGGVLVQNCEFDGQSVTIIYGHLKLSSIAKKTGDGLSKGEQIGILGKAYSAQTDGERKHLHLGAHKGTAVNILGYVQKEADLSGWTDPCSLETTCE